MYRAAKIRLQETQSNAKTVVVLFFFSCFKIRFYPNLHLSRQDNYFTVSKLRCRTKTVILWSQIRTIIQPIIEIHCHPIQNQSNLRCGFQMLHNKYRSIECAIHCQNKVWFSRSCCAEQSLTEFSLQKNMLPHICPKQRRMITCY